MFNELSSRASSVSAILIYANRRTRGRLMMLPTSYSCEAASSRSQQLTARRRRAAAEAAALARCRRSVLYDETYRSKPFEHTLFVTACQYFRHPAAGRRRRRRRQANPSTWSTHLLAEEVRRLHVTISLLADTRAHYCMDITDMI